jgi:Flp pilus assembly protein TadG
MIEKILHGIKKWVRDESGVSAVEFSMVGTGFILLLLGVIELGRLAWTMNAVDYAADSALRYAVIHQDSTESEVQDEMRDKLATFYVQNDQVTVSVAMTSVSNLDFVEITGRYRYEPFVLGFLPTSLSTYVMEFSARRPVYDYPTEEDESP